MRETYNSCNGCTDCIMCGRKTPVEHIICDKCGDEIPDESLIFEDDGDELCEDCFIERYYEKNADKLTASNALTLGEEDTEEVELNGFLAWFYTADQIEDILMKELEMDFTPESLIEYLDGEYKLLEEVDGDGSD